MFDNLISSPPEDAGVNFKDSMTLDNVPFAKEHMKSEQPWMHGNY